MGLGGRRDKQRIVEDPRNTKWLNDESSPGHRLLRSMGWKPDSDSSRSALKTGLMAHHSTKRLRAIPIAKSGAEGIGYKPDGAIASASLEQLPSRPSTAQIGIASAASSVFTRLGSKAALKFVSAGANAEVVSRAKTDGGEFQGLLQRLNAATARVEAPTESNDGKPENDPIEETKEEQRERRGKRKLEKDQKRQAKRARIAQQVPSATPLTTAACSDKEPIPVTTISNSEVRQSVNLNPRMA